MNFCFYIIPSWICYHMLEYFLHSLGHSYKYGSYIYRIHKNHHTIHYPTHKLLSNGYRTNSIYGLSEGVVAYGPPILIFFSCLYFIVELHTFFILLCEILLIAYLSDYLHCQIHLNGSWLEKYKWFQKKRKEHFIHHLNMNKNMNIIDFSIDKWNLTYKY